VPLQELPRALQWLREELLPELAWPLVARAFAHLLTGDHLLPHLEPGDRDLEPGDRDRSAGGARAADARAAIRVSEAFVVKYNASSGQRLLKPHRDGALFSFNLALNDLDEYEGGGTYFRSLEGSGTAAALRSPKGHLLAHSSALVHGGHPITSGVRYILVAFCTIDPAYSRWAYALSEHVQAVVDPGEVDEGE